MITRIRQLRSQMLIHSYLYYQLDTNLITDHQFDERAAELAGLQAQLFMPVGWYDEEFVDWTGATGCHLVADHWVVDKANYLVKLCARRAAAVVSFL